LVVANRRQKLARGSFLKVLIPPGKSGNVLATIAIGEQYLQPFMKYAYHTWEMYCRRHDLGLILFDDDLISPDHPKWKKANWQKYLIPSVIVDSGLPVKNVCHLDTDILISPLAPNIFDAHVEENIGVISLRTGLPYPHIELCRRLAFARNINYSSSYPLDSALFISLSDLYSAIGAQTQSDEACSGVFVFSIENHRNLFSEFFAEFDQSVLSPTSGGDQTHFNYLVQSNNLAQWLDYRFQAQWTYEMAWKYPFLYSTHRNNLAIIKLCIEASLFSNYFLHFAGSWYESEMWEQVKVLDTPESLEMFSAFDEYMKMPVYGKPLGAIKPKENS
jgi:hypothetical protein